MIQAMMTTAEYRTRAKAALQSAALATDPVTRAQFEMIANHWLALANVGAVQEVLARGLPDDEAQTWISPPH
jgi:hypothetical protein